MGGEAPALLYGPLAGAAGTMNPGPAILVVAIVAVIALLFGVR